MSSPSVSWMLVGLLLAALAKCPSAQAQNAAPARPAGDSAAKNASGDLSKFCANITPSVEEVRIAWQIDRLNKLDEQVRQRLAELEKAESEARNWVSRREALMKSGSDNVVAIYAKMQPENAASQINAMEDSIAVSILGKLNPRAAGAILQQMEADRAGKLSAILSGAVSPEQKS